MPMLDNERPSSESEWFEIYCAHARGEREDIVPFPEDEIQIITNGLKGEQTARQAVTIWKYIKDVASKYIDLDRDAHVLDYGCGWGRMTRLLPYYFPSGSIHGVDVDERLVGSARELLPDLNHTLIESMKALPFEDETFDLIFANSVFSHLSGRSARFTLSELARTLKTDGVVILSVLDRSDLDRFYSKQAEWAEKVLGAPEDAYARLEAEGFVWADTKRWADYGIAVMSPDWMRGSMNEVGLDLVQSEKSTLGTSQTYMVGVKRGSA
jgi:ubiquinone/menaquinone biosynthesis C-methylase UbiE